VGPSHLNWGSGRRHERRVGHNAWGAPPCAPPRLVGFSCIHGGPIDISAAVG
jgi:hypothetical protein